MEQSQAEPQVPLERDEGYAQDGLHQIFRLRLAEQSRRYVVPLPRG